MPLDNSSGEEGLSGSFEKCQLEKRDAPRLSIECILQMLPVDDINLLRKRLIENEYIYYIVHEVYHREHADDRGGYDLELKSIRAKDEEEALWKIFNQDYRLMFALVDSDPDNLIKIVAEHYRDDENYDKYADSGWLAEYVFNNLYHEKTTKILKDCFTKEELIKMLKERLDMDIYLRKAGELW